MDKRGKSWAYRTVKNGRVKINGRYFAPSEKRDKYDGRFEGKRFLFGLYWSVSDLLGWYMLDRVYLWGTEECGKSINTDLYEEMCKKGRKILCNEQGYYIHKFWYEITPV